MEMTKIMQRLKTFSGYLRSKNLVVTTHTSTQATKPPRPMGIIAASVPPAMIISASPRRMWFAAA